MKKFLFWLINGAAVLFGGATAVEGALNIKDGVKAMKQAKTAQQPGPVEDTTEGTPEPPEE